MRHRFPDLFRNDRAPRDDGGPGSPGPSTAVVVAAWLVVGLVACAIQHPLHVPLQVDNQHYFFIAERAASGTPPHVSQFEPKNAVSMLMTAAAMKVGRVVGVSDLMSARALSVLFAAMVVPLVWLVTREMTTNRVSPHLAAGAMLSFATFFHMAAMGARPKVFLATFLLLTTLAVARRRPAVAGVMAAAAFLCWQPGLLLLGSALVVFVLTGSGLRSIGVCAGAFLAVTLAYEGYFLAHGVLGVQIEQAYLFPATYMQADMTPTAEIAGRRLLWTLKLGHGPQPRNAIAIVALIGFVAWWVRVALRPATLLSLRARPGPAFLVLAGHVALAFTLTNFQGHPDAFLVEPFIAVLAGLTAGALVGLVTERAGAGAGRVLIGVCAAALALLAVSRAGDRASLERRYSLADQLDAGSRVGELLDEGLSVYAVGCTHLLAFNHVSNFVPFGFFFRGLSPYIEQRFGTPIYLPYRDDRPPDVILASRSGLTGADQWLRENYRETPEPLFAAQGIRVWRREPAQSR